MVSVRSVVNSRLVGFYFVLSNGQITASMHLIEIAAGSCLPFPLIKSECAAPIPAIVHWTVHFQLECNKVLCTVCHTSVDPYPLIFSTVSSFRVSSLLECRPVSVALFLVAE